MTSITELAVSLDEEQEKQLIDDGFIKTNVSLDPNDTYFLWFKKCDSPAITRIQFSFNNEMAKGLIASGFQKIDRNLNPDGNEVFLWYYKGSSDFDVPIVEINFDGPDENDTYNVTWEIVACYAVSQESESQIIAMWVKKEKLTYLCDITATDTFEADAELFQQGYARIDLAINRAEAGICVFIWYRATTESAGAITDLSSSDLQHYTKVNQNLLEGTGEGPCYLWYTRAVADKNPIKAVSLVPAAVETYRGAGNLVIPISGVPIDLYLIH